MEDITWLPVAAEQEHSPFRYYGAPADIVAAALGPMGKKGPPIGFRLKVDGADELIEVMFNEHGTIDGFEYVEQ